jgi:HPt (histidine-containing phosphotransfer) domain-containing protein
LQKSRSPEAAPGVPQPGPWQAPPPIPSAASNQRSDAVSAALQKAALGFVSRLPQRVSTLVSLSDAGDWQELRRTLHQIKGAGSGYGFPKLTETAARAEASIKTSAGIETIKSQIDELIALIRSTQGYSPALEKQRNNDQPETAHH